ncbi:MAG: glycine--tRNA ligase subunit beta [Acidobacteria bacterium]|nr:glycine--tRNA ligase subunit beta [Acidobacteriota bacterium]
MNAVMETSAGEVPEPATAESLRWDPLEETEFTLEIGTEEVPALMMPSALLALEENFTSALRAAQLEFNAVRASGTPRRLILHCTAVAGRQTDILEQVTGPPRTVAFDEKGNPTRALQGFLRKNEIDIEQIRRISTPKGEYVAFQKLIPGSPAREVLAEVLPRLVLSIPFPKSMYWTARQERFVRPIHYVLALLGAEVVPFEVAGIQSGRYTMGHLILAPEVFPVNSFAQLKEKLAEHFVLIDPEERRSIIVRGLMSALPKRLRVVQDAALLEEVVHLVEYPQVLLGEFDARFLQLPDEILITVLKKQQKYFAVTDDRGRIRPYFLTVLNTSVTHSEKIRDGHQRVLRARLEDAAFYLEFDSRKKLQERAPLLDHVLFHEKLGSYGEKVRRLDKLVQDLALETSLKDGADLRTAVRLCKTDLTTEMVKEFTELQGIVGGLYARGENYPGTVWRAIYQHYQPIAAESPIPDSHIAQLLSLADKIDTLCGFFCIGIIPTGSSDPFSLRRQCQGIIRITIEGALSFSLRRLFTTASDLFKGLLERTQEEIIGDLFDFFSARVRHLFKEKGLQYDVINAVVEAGYDDLLDLYRRAAAVQAIRKEPDFEAIAVSFKRINNILAGQVQDGGTVQDALLKEPAEQELYREITTWEPTINHNMRQNNYYDALKIMARMRPQLDHFFDKVLVMAEDPKVRENRLRLLHRISFLFRQVGDLSQIVVE